MAHSDGGHTQTWHLELIRLPFCLLHPDHRHILLTYRISFTVLCAKSTFKASKEYKNRRSHSGFVLQGHNFSCIIHLKSLTLTRLRRYELSCAQRASLYNIYKHTHTHINTHNLLPSSSTVPEITSHLAQGILLNTNTTQKLNTQMNKCKPSHGEGTFWEEPSSRERKEVREVETSLTRRVKVSVRSLKSPGESQPEWGIFGSWVLQTEGLRSIHRDAKLSQVSLTQVCDQQALSHELKCVSSIQRWSTYWRLYLTGEDKSNKT